MREILFRGKRVDNEEFVFGDFITGQGYKKGKSFILPQTSVYPPGCSNLDGWEVIPETVGQYTGLEDMKGVKIFEGDILESEDFSNVVVGYSENFACFVGGDFSFSDLDPDDEQWWVVIGNLHENPELLS